MKKGVGIAAILARCYDREMNRLSKYIYEAVRLEKDHPDLSDFFAKMAREEIEILRKIEELSIVYSGREDEKITDVGSMIRLCQVRLESDMPEYERLLSLWNGTDHIDSLFRMIDKKRDMLEEFERMNRS